MISSKADFLKTCLVFLFPLLMVYRLLVARGINLYLIWPIYFFTVYYGIYCYRRTIRNLGVNKSVKYWLIYVLLSIVSYIFSRSPIECYISEIYVFILPVFFVFIGSYDNDRQFYKWYVYAVIFCILVGLFLFIMQPPWYVKFLLDFRNSAWYSTSTYDSVYDIKFASFFGSSYAVSFFSTFASCILISDIYTEKCKRIFNSRYIQFVFLAICYIGALLCRHRVAIIFPPAMFAFYILKGVFKGDKNNFIVLLFFGVFIFVLSIIAERNSSTALFFVVEDVKNRFTEMTLENAMEGSRTNQNVDVLTSWDNIIFGDGLGSKNGGARQAGLPGITDGNFVKILVENGVVGLLWFLIFVSKSLKKALLRKNKSTIEAWIILFMLFAMTGSNGLCIEFYYSAIFWYAIGKIWSTKRI